MRNYIVIVMCCLGLSNCSFLKAKNQPPDFLNKTEIRQIYQKLIAATGQTQDAEPLIIDDSDIDNAYNDGTKIVIYKGFLKHAHSWDEIALVLGHEIAHGMLGHLKELYTRDPHKIAVLEANADKMGAFYMMRAGFNICQGREVFKYWEGMYGNSLGEDHPDDAYRYAELNVGCS